MPRTFTSPASKQAPWPASTADLTPSKRPVSTASRGWRAAWPNGWCTRTAPALS